MRRIQYQEVIEKESDFLAMTYNGTIKLDRERRKNKV